MLSVLFAKEEEQEELNEISVVFDENKIDVELVKFGVPLFFNRDNLKEAEELCVVLEEIVDFRLNHSSAELLTQLFCKHSIVDTLSRHRKFLIIFLKSWKIRLDVPTKLRMGKILIFS